MNRHEQLRSIRTAAVKANPDSFGGGYDDRPIGLADVLLAMDKVHAGYAVDERGYFMKLREADQHQNIYDRVHVGQCWNLRQDDLTEQSDVCITFLADLLA